MLAIALAAGALSGAILLFLSHIAPRLGAGNFIRDLDQPHVFGRALSPREAHVLGALVHICISALFGLGYGILVQAQVFPGFEFFSLLGWSLVMSLFVGGIVLPLEGHGIFGVREDAWFPVDLILTNAFWAVLFWLILQWWPSVL